MASERQIAANRRNARKSTGPRSAAGKKRASRNAYRHGLTLSVASTKASAKQLDKLVRRIAGDTEDAIVLERARARSSSACAIARARSSTIAFSVLPAISRTSLSSCFANAAVEVMLKVRPWR